MKRKQINKPLVVLVIIVVTLLCLVAALVVTYASRKQTEEKEITISSRQSRQYLTDKFVYLKSLETPKALVTQGPVISDDCHWGHYSIPFNGPIPLPSGGLQTPNTVTCFATMSASFLYSTSLCETYNQLLSHQAVTDSSYYFTGTGPCNANGQSEPGIDFGDTTPFPGSQTAVKLSKISTGSYSTKLTVNINIRYYDK